MYFICISTIPNLYSVTIAPISQREHISCQGRHDDHDAREAEGVDGDQRRALLGGDHAVECDVGLYLNQVVGESGEEAAERHEVPDAGEFADKTYQGERQAEYEQFAESGLLDFARCEGADDPAHRHDEEQGS